MTVIVCRDGIMAADTAVWQDNVIAGHTRKVHRLKDGRLFAASGDCGMCDAVRDWLNGDGEKPAPGERGDFGALLLSPKGRLQRVDYGMRVLDEPDNGFHVVGAHTELLIGALAAGATAEQAVRIAIQYGDSAGGDVQVESLDMEHG